MPPEPCRGCVQLLKGWATDMSLLSAIPGLSAHDTHIPPLPLPIVVSFNNAAAQDLIRLAVTDVATSYPSPDPWGWLTDNRPDVIKELSRVKADMQSAYESADIERVQASCDVFVRFHKKAWQLYSMRPPVIEVQGDLL